MVFNCLTEFSWKRENVSPFRLIINVGMFEIFNFGLLGDFNNIIRELSNNDEVFVGEWDQSGKMLKIS